MAEENRFRKFLKQHKQEFVVVGVTITTVVGTVLLVKNLEILKGMAIPPSAVTVKPQAMPVEVTKITKEPMLKIIDVQAHLRNLPKGYHASTYKMQEAAENGIALSANQTWVSAYPRCYAA